MSVHDKDADEDTSWLVLEHCSADDSVNNGADLDNETGTEKSNSSSGGDDVDADLPHCISSMLCGDNVPYKRLLETLTELRGEAHLELPTIVVCGAQSHGKSSTLERIAQREVFPRDSKICTRMVVRLMLRRNDEKETKVRVFDTEKGTGIRPSWTDITEDSQLPAAISDIMNKFLDKTHEGQPCAIDGRHELQVVLQAPNVPTIDLVDLPGIDSLTEDAAPMLLAKQFLAKEDTLVVAVACASDKQIGASAIWRLLSETESPAVVALTHMDVSRHSKADMIDILNKQPKFVADCGTVQSVIPVANRDTLNAGAQVSLRGALASEEASLTSKLEQIGVLFNPSRHGICAVVGALDNMLHEHMADAWGRAELIKLVCNLVPIARELGKLGVRPEVITRAEIDDAIKTAWAHLVSRDLSKWNAAAHRDRRAGDETQSGVLFGLRIEQAGDLEQQFDAELDIRMEFALRSVQSMLEESIQAVCAEPPVKLVRFSAIIELCKKALQDVFEKDRAQIRSELKSSARRMIKDAMLSLDSDEVDVATLTNNVKALVFTDVAYSLLRRGAFFAAVEAQLGTGVRSALLEETHAARRQELENKVDLVGKAAMELLALMSTTSSDAEEVAADIDKVVSASKSGRVGGEPVDVLGLRAQNELFSATASGREGVVKVLLDNGADVHAKEDDGWLALHQACLNGHEGVAKLLLDYGADVHAKEDDGWRALHSACANGHEGVAKLLLDNGADVHARRNDSWLPLHVACFNGHEGVVKLLLDNGADLHARKVDGWRALHLACFNGHEVVAKLLLDNGADVHAKEDDGWRALHSACLSGHECVAKLLLDNDADVHAKANSGWLALHSACANGHEGVVKLLLDNDADVHAKANNGWRALHSACANGHEGVVKLLLDNDADLHAKSNNGDTPLHLACEKGHEVVAKLLLDTGTDVDTKHDGGWMALHVACQNGHDGVAKVLLDNGADVHATTKVGGTPMHLACFNGREGVAELLLDRGADVHAELNDGKTALHWALENGHEGIAKLLRDRGAIA